MNKDIIKLISFKEREKISKVIQVFNKTAPLTDSKGFGVVVNKSKKCIGVITDGDIRRILNRTNKNLTIKNVYNKKFSFAKVKFVNTNRKNKEMHILYNLIINILYHFLLYLHYEPYSHRTQL